MLKGVILGVLLIPALALAEPVKVAKPVVCDDMDTMLNYFQKEWSESPMLMGDVTENEHVVVLTNEETKSWTMVQFNTNLKVACVLESGKGIKFKLPGIGV